MRSLRTDLVAGMVVAMVVAASLGAYFTLSFPKESTKVVSPISVFTNQLFFIQQGPGVDANGLSIGIWQAKFSNNENTTLNVNVGLYGNREPITFNSTSLESGQVANISDCFLSYRLKGPFTSEIFGSSQSGVITPEYQVKVANATVMPFSNQFSLSTHVGTPVYNGTYNLNQSRWTISVTNLGVQPIAYLYAELTNASKIVEPPVGLRCAGSPGHQGAPYSQILTSGNTSEVVENLIATGSEFSSGQSFNVRVIAVYGNGAEVMNTVAVEVGK